MLGLIRGSGIIAVHFADSAGKCGFGTGTESAGLDSRNNGVEN